MNPDKFDLRRARLQSQKQTGLIIALFVVALLVGAIFRLGGQRAVSGEPVLAGGASPVGPGMSAGQRLYIQFCASCHAQDGSGNPVVNIPPLNADGTAWQKTPAELKTHILDGGDTMPELTGLVSESDADLLLEYIQLWWTDEQREAFGNP
jgi:mono/diheme cytochrome c family protein